MIEKRCTDVCEVSVGVAFRCDTLIDLKYVHAFPRNLFVGESTKHHPWRVTSADRHDETAAFDDGLSRLRGDQRRSFPCHHVSVLKHFDSHRCYISPPSGRGGHARIKKMQRY